jgi:hypothetical protein
LTPAHDIVYFAYAPIYGYQDHLDYLANVSSRATSVPFTIRTLGMSSQGRPVDLLTIGTLQQMGNPYQHMYARMIKPQSVALIISCHLDPLLQLSIVTPSVVTRSQTQQPAGRFALNNCTFYPCVDLSFHMEPPGLSAVCLTFYLGGVLSRGFFLTNFFLASSDVNIISNLRERVSGRRALALRRFNEEAVLEHVVRSTPTIRERERLRERESYAKRSCV